MRHWSIVKYFSLAHFTFENYEKVLQWNGKIVFISNVNIKISWIKLIFLCIPFMLHQSVLNFWLFLWIFLLFVTLDRVIDAEWFVINHPDICNYQRLWAVHNTARTSFKCHFCLQQSSSCLRVFWQGQHISHSVRWRGFRTFDLCFSVFTCSSHSRVLLSNVENSLSLY